MTDMTKHQDALHALADRCEREEPSRELDEAIGRWFAHNAYAWWRARTGKSAFTQDIHAAATLVPGGRWELHVVVGHAVAIVPVDSLDEDAESSATSITPASALCAAALRARAAQ